MMFGLNPKSLHEIEEALAQPNCTVDELLKCAGVTSQFRNGNPALISFLLNEKNAKRIFEIIHTNSNRSTQKSILALFQTSNTALHRLFADYLQITEYAISILESDMDHANFSVGIISRVVSRAFDLWPDDMSEIFRISKTLYKTLITHIDNICVYHSVQDMITDTHKGLWLFIWHCFRTLVGSEHEHEYQLIRRSALIDDSWKIDQSLITDLHRDHIINVLRLFFKLKLNCEETFAENVTRYILNQSEMTALLYSLALSLHPNEIIMKRAVNEIKTRNDFADPIIEKSLNYITFALSMVSNETLVDVISTVLLHENSSNLVLNALKTLLISIFCENDCNSSNDVNNQDLQNLSNGLNPENGDRCNDTNNFGDSYLNDEGKNQPKRDIEELRKEVKRIVLEDYRKTSEEQNPMYFAFLMSIAIDVNSNTEGDDEWKKFYTEVVYPWNKEDEDTEEPGNSQTS
ncbi:hypothetical protein TRFO_13461 [Tritrichomonas foetus]|uniref:Uncharacterized protein n=1 Tax=Tritrichomonas foetus TaxID=1144522 RepID=A0A1J4L2L0_9EUKA|nr:hypothetical protein TRFO_13461 [Tritrichomonas foetus]|eukprot:OHT16133.1 hypothetical protein TRFO_13461 [Tritrichomonas foetus]